MYVFYRSEHQSRHGPDPARSSKGRWSQMLSPALLSSSSSTASSLSPSEGVILVIDEELGEYAQIEQQSAETAGQPGSINEHIPAVYPALLAGLAFRVATHGVIGEDAEDVGQVAQAGEEEEENADALGGLAPEIQEELGEARPRGIIPHTASRISDRRGRAYLTVEVERGEFVRGGGGRAACVPPA